MTYTTYTFNDRNNINNSHTDIHTPTHRRRSHGNL